MKIVEKAKEKLDELTGASRKTAKETKEDTLAAWDGFSEYTAEKKSDAVDFLNRQMIVLDQKIEAINERSQESAEAGKSTAKESLKSLKQKRADLALQIDKVQNASSETWEEVKLETRKKWNTFSESVKELTSRIKSS